MVPLHGKLHDAYAEALRGGREGAGELGKTAPRAEVVDVLREAHRDVNRQEPGEPLAREVRHARARAVRFAAGVLPFAAAGTKTKGDLSHAV